MISEALLEVGNWPLFLPRLIIPSMCEAMDLLIHFFLKYTARFCDTIHDGGEWHAKMG